MIRFWKTEKKVKSKFDRTVFTSFSNVESDQKGVLVASDSVNCDCKGGMLSRGLGREIFCTDSGCKVYIPNKGCCALAYVYKDMGDVFEKKLVCMGRDGSLDIFNENYEDFETEDVFEQECKMLYFVNENKEVGLFIYGEGVAVLYYPTSGVHKLSYAVQSACVYNHRLFMALHPFKIAYSAVCDGERITESLEDGGTLFYFSEGGEKIRAMQVLDGCIYLFSSHAIGRLKTAGDPRDFVLEKVPYAGGEIFGDSVATVGNRICFLATDGVYSFNGTVAKKTHEKLPIFPKREGQVCGYCIFEDQYILHYIDAEKGTQMVVLNGDGENGYFSFSSDGVYNLEGLAVHSQEERFYIFDPNGELPDGEEAFFKTEKVRFSVGKTAISELSFEGEGSVQLTVTSERENKTYPLTFADGKAVLKTRLLGEGFVFRFQLQPGAKIKRMEVLTETLGG